MTLYQYNNITIAYQKIINFVYNTLNQPPKFRTKTELK